VGKVLKEKIILGLDPGTVIMGYGLISIKGTKLELLQFGVIHLDKYDEHELRLKKIFDLMKLPWKLLSLERMFSRC
jgi:crossover junction endodeoxyribonuclease RuvC